ncbi:MAG TPA: carbamoyl-phosphate synthase large subunit, partial [Oligoflexia bacterium]|nr:carbamoyl-phosphate synthase large subunit [Oligoflexia bacterium]
ETVSTDYDTSDRLYFEPLTLEDVLEIVHRENPWGVIVQYGGQTPLRLAEALQEQGVPIIGTSPAAIDLTEDRRKFSDLLDRVGLRQSESGTAATGEEAAAVAERIGFPLLVRPSFVLGGRAMAIIHNHQELNKYIQESVSVSFDRPVLLDRFLDNATEVDVDAVCDGTDVVVAGVVEHIELAGVHSGDSAFMLPAQSLGLGIIAEIERATRALALACNVEGLMNVQFAICNRELYVLEVNPRASRSVPFVSKVTGVPWAKVAARVMAGETLRELDTLGTYGKVLAFAQYSAAAARIPYVAVKESVFPFAKFRGVDTVLGPEMRSTGEVMGVGDTAAGGFYRAQVAAGTSLPLGGTAFLSVRDADKDGAVLLAKKLNKLGFKLVGTRGTAAYLSKRGVEIEEINKVRDGSPHIVDRLLSGGIDMVINTPEGTGPLLDSRSIRSTATELALPLFTTLAAAVSAVEAIEQLKRGKKFEVRPIQEYLSLIAISN